MKEKLFYMPEDFYLFPSSTEICTALTLSLARRMREFLTELEFDPAPACTYFSKWANKLDMFGQFSHLNPWLMFRAIKMMDLGWLVFVTIQGF